jgi:preprotein translocase subunit SecE
MNYDMGWAKLKKQARKEKLIKDFGWIVGAVIVFAIIYYLINVFAS